MCRGLDKLVSLVNVLWAEAGATHACEAPIGTGAAAADEVVDAADIDVGWGIVNHCFESVINCCLPFNAIVKIFCSTYR